MVALKLRKIGSSLGVALPREVLARLRVSLGDTLLLTESAEGYRLTADGPESARQMTAARRIMGKRRAALRKLAR